MSEAATPKSARPTGQTDADVVESIANRVCRATLRALAERTGPVEVSSLASLVAAETSDEDLDDVTSGERGRTLVDLAHTHLPKLAEAGLVDWDSEAETVAPADHPLLRDGRFRDLLTVDGGDCDAVLRTLRTPQRRAVLDTLAETDELDRRDLARRLVAREEDVAASDAPEQDVLDAAVQLHHVHLPALANAGLIDYEDGTARYVGHDEFDPAWIAREFDATV